jgi:sulfur carrier protein
MRCVVTGNTENLPDGLTVAYLLREKGLDRAACAVEVNEAIVRKADHAEHTLGEGDRVEIVTLVGGG